MDIKRLGQAATEYILLTAIVLIILIPLMIGPSESLVNQRINIVDDAVRAVKNGAVTLTDLGEGSSTRVVVQIPRGVTYSNIDKNTITVIVNGREVDIDVGIPVYGWFPTNEGRHYIDLLNNGSSILLYECGNGQIEDNEQCELGNPADSICNWGATTCGQPGTVNACKCLAPCPQGYSPSSTGGCLPQSSCGDGQITNPPETCDPLSTIPNQGCPLGLECTSPSCTCQVPSGSGPCSNPNVCETGENCLLCDECECPPGQICNSIGSCVSNPPPTCASNSDCGPYVCNLATNTCQPCNGIPCGPGYVCNTITGTCGPACTPTSCPLGTACTPSGTCQPTAPSCGDNIANQAWEQCDTGLSSTIPSGTQGSCAANQICHMPFCACASPTCGNGLLETFNGEQCDDGNIFNNDYCNNLCKWTFCGDSLAQSPNGYGYYEYCDNPDFNGYTSLTCPSGTLTCNSNCRLQCGNTPYFPGCGNTYLDFGEECDLSAGVDCLVGTCNSCSCDLPIPPGAVGVNPGAPNPPYPPINPPIPPPAGGGGACSTTGSPGTVTPTTQNPYGVTCSNSGCPPGQTCVPQPGGTSVGSNYCYCGPVGYNPGGTGGTSGQAGGIG